MSKKTEGGYVGLVVLIISVAIIGLLYTKMYFAPKPPPAADSFQPLMASGTPATTGYEQARADVDAAKAIQAKLNEHNVKTNAALAE